MSTAVVWFRRDLRLEDNPALDAALRTHERVVCAYIHAPVEEAPWAPGAASRWWLHHSLTALDASLRLRGAELHVRRGPTSAALDNLVRLASADAVYWNRLYEPAIGTRDDAVEAGLRARGIAARRFNANLLFEPWDLQTGAGGPYRVFTPFWRNARARLEPAPPLPAPKRIASMHLDGSVAIEALRMLPRRGWDAGFRPHWNPGEAGAQSRLRDFRDRALTAYARGRDRPDLDQTSSLSPHLHFGEIGPRQVVWTLEALARDGLDANARAGIDAFLRELGWREFAHHLLHHFAETPQRNFNRAFDGLAYAAAEVGTIERWRNGMTGFPIIDAGMRQLWSTGWMHNRVRMLVASFLTKNLRQHWREGARWFWDTLVDADLANNTLGWQWSAGSGADAAPYFRIFNPVTQGERFDPDGAYVKRWVPELRQVAASHVHQPWRQPALLQQTGYPAPMIDLSQSRDEALQAYRALRRFDA